MRKLLAPYFSLEGRSSRREWWILEILIVLGFRLNELLFDTMAGDGGRFDLGQEAGQTWMMLAATLLWLNIASNVRRLHDRGKSGWWSVIYLIPGVGQLWCFVECGFLQGQPQSNKYGPPPGARTIYQTLAGQMTARLQALRAAPAAPAPIAVASSVPNAPASKTAGRRVSVLESSNHRPTVQRRGGSTPTPTRPWRIAFALAALGFVLVGLVLTGGISVVSVSVNPGAPIMEPTGQP